MNNWKLDDNLRKIHQIWISYFQLFQIHHWKSRTISYWHFQVLTKGREKSSWERRLLQCYSECRLRFQICLNFALFCCNINCCSILLSNAYGQHSIQTQFFKNILDKHETFAKFDVFQENIRTIFKLFFRTFDFDWQVWQVQSFSIVLIPSQNCLLLVFNDCWQCRLDDDVPSSYFGRVENCYDKTRRRRAGWRRKFMEIQSWSVWVCKM